MSVKARQHVEREIAKALIKEALAAGYAISVNNGGEEDEIEPSTDADIILAAMFATDDEKLHYWKRTEDGWKHVGWVWLVYGNDGGENVISDHTTNLSTIMASAEKEASKWQ